jgi:MFS family permease
MRGLDKKLIAISISALFVDFCAGVIRPVLPLLSRQFDASYFLVGLVASSYGIARLAVDVPFGSIVDRAGKRPLLLAGILIHIFGSAIGALATNIYHLILFSFLRGVAYAAYFDACYTLVGDIAPANKRARYMSINLASSLLGISVGSAIGGEVSNKFGLHFPFVLTLLVLLTGCLFTYLAVQEDERPRKVEWIPLSGILRIRNRNLIVVYVASFVSFFSGMSIVDVFIPLYSRTVLGLSLAEVGFVSTLESVSMLTTLLGFGQIADRLSRKTSLFLGFALLASSTLVLGQMWNLGMYLVVSLIFGVSRGILSPVIRACVMDLADHGRRGTTLGVQRLFCDLGATLGPISLGHLSDLFGLSAAFSVAATVSACTCAAVLSMRRMETVVSAGSLSPNELL